MQTNESNAKIYTIMRFGKHKLNGYILSSNCKYKQLYHFYKQYDGEECLCTVLIIYIYIHI